MYYVEIFRKMDMRGQIPDNTFIWLQGNADVRRVSWVSSISFLLGMLKMKAACSEVAALDVIL